MRIAIDAREASTVHPTGKGLWARYVISELERREPDLETLGRRNKKWLWHWQTAQALKKNPPDLYVSPTSCIVPTLLKESVPYAIVVHDLIAFDNEPHDRKATFIERLTLPPALTHAKYIFTVSEATKRELLEQFPQIDSSKVTTVYEGPTITKLETGNWKLETETRYVLCLGTLCPRKNQLRLIHAWKKLPEHLRAPSKLLLVGGRGWNDDEIVLQAKHTAGVEWKGYVPEEKLSELLQNATCLALPSLKEGFGLPILDAMTVGIPVLTSNRSSMQEVAGDAALLIDPENVDEMAKGLELLLTDEEMRNDLIQRGKRQAEKFSWERTVDTMLETFDGA